MRQRTGQDGILHLDIPIGVTDQDVEVLISYQLDQPAAALDLPLDRLYGICADDPIITDDQGISDTLDDELADAFD